eukprot:scaffold149160_cov18-Tisochrysis_lutea.AAC.1
MSHHTEQNLSVLMRQMVCFSMWDEVCLQTAQNCIAARLERASGEDADTIHFEARATGPHFQILMHRTHACDVLRTLHVIMTRGGVKGALSKAQDVALMAAYLAAVIHDYEHKGRISLHVCYHTRSE